jgi:hypothetical protein
MPKSQLAIKRFEGGLHTNADPRDIADNEFSALKGFDVDSLGRIVMMGSHANHSAITAQTTAFKAGYGIFAFSSDYDDAGALASTNYLALTDGSYVRIWDDGGAAWDGMNDDAVPSTGFSLGDTASTPESHTDVEASMYAPDGGLRVCDGNFTNYANVPKLLNYIPSKTYGGPGTVTYPTAYGQTTVGGDWVVNNASIETGLTSANLKMINLGSKTKGLIEGDHSGIAIITAVSGNAVTIIHSGIDHLASEASLSGSDDHYNGLTCSFFNTATAGTTAIYGVVYDYDHDTTSNTHSKFYVWCGPDGNVTPAAAIAAQSADTDVTNWSFQVGQHEGYLWRSENTLERNRGVINADFGVTLSFDEGTSGEGTWMPAESPNTRYKFYHSTVFDGIQESNPALFTMYPTKQAAGEVTHDTVDEMYFRDGNSTTDMDGEASDDNNIGTASTDVPISFGLLVRTVSDTTTTSFTDSCTYNNDPTITHSDDNGKIGVGMAVRGTGIPHDSYVASVTSDTHFELNASTTGGATTSTLTFNEFSDSGGNTATDFHIGHAHHTYGSQDTSRNSVNGTGGITNGTYNFLGGNQRVTGGRIYWASSEDGYTNLYLLIDYDLEKGGRTHGSGGGSGASGYSPWVSWVYPTASAPIIRPDWSGSQATWNDPPTLLTYEDINLYPHDSKLNAKWKTAVVANSRTYAANIKRQQQSTFEGGGTWHQSATPTNDPEYQDRIIRSAERRFDTFPEENAFLIGESNDGDSIIKLETFADRLFVFGKYKLKIVNIQNDNFVLESENPFMGLDGGHPAQSVATDIGIAWINSQGVYFYNGENIQSLSEKIRNMWIGEDGYDAFWFSGDDGDPQDIPAITYDPKAKKLICIKTITDGTDNDGSNKEHILVYSFRTNAWTYKENALTNDTEKRFTVYKNELIFDNESRMQTWSDSPASGVSGGATIFTKDIDFGLPAIRKKIYKVHITYKTGNASGSQSTHIQVKYGINGDSSPTETFTVPELPATSSSADWHVASLIPSSSINDAKSFRLQFVSDDVVLSSFEINDITIIYRVKSIK